MIRSNMATELTELEKTRVSLIHRQRLESCYHLVELWRRSKRTTWCPQDAPQCDNQLVLFVQSGTC